MYTGATQVEMEFAQCVAFLRVTGDVPALLELGMILSCAFINKKELGP